MSSEAAFDWESLRAIRRDTVGHLLAIWFDGAVRHSANNRILAHCVIQAMFCAAVVLPVTTCPLPAHNRPSPQTKQWKQRDNLREHFLSKGSNQCTHPEHSLYGHPPPPPRPMCGCLAREESSHTPVF